MKIEDFKMGLATLQDVKALVQLEIACFAGDRISEIEYKRLLKRNSVKVYVVSFQGSIIASAVLIIKKAKSKARLYSFCVTPPMRSVGIGNALIEVIEKDAYRHECEAIYLEVSKNNQMALDMYHHRNFQLVGTLNNYYQDGSDALRMEKDITYLKNSILT